MTRKARQTIKPLSWYGVKTIYRAAARGRPLAKDRAYDPGMTLVEERIVLFRARSFADAIRAARKEARTYEGDRHINPYGQTVVRRRLKGFDAFLLFDPSGQGREVFSMTEVVSKHVPDVTVAKHRFGHEESTRERRSRRNILNREFSGSARGGVKRPR